MKYNHLLTAFSAIALADGLMALFAPGAFVNVLWPRRFGPEVYFFIHGWGACLIGFSVMAWVARNLADANSRRLCALGLFVYHLIATGVFLVDGLSNGWTPLSMTTMVLLALFTIAFGYFRFGNPALVLLPATAEARP